MLSKAKIKYIHSLEQKKCRRQEKAFVAEGHKTVGELLCEHFLPLLIVATEEWKSPVALDPNKTEFITVTDEELRKASLLLHPQQVIGVFSLPEEKNLPSHYVIDNDLVLCLDGVQDPGNLGTIIRTADWFGIKHIVCSRETADAYSPKVVQATMGSIARVNIYYTDLPSYLRSFSIISPVPARNLPDTSPIYGTLLDGENIYHAELKNHGIIVMGNEGNGISAEIRKMLTHKLLIPPFPEDKRTAESLNVSIATSIILSLFRMQKG